LASNGTYSANFDVRFSSLAITFTVWRRDLSPLSC
jgi:hypothetical protein